MLINFCLRITRTKEEGGEGEEVENDDVFSSWCIFGIFLYDHVCLLITSYFTLD